jgi:putative ABC transport system permease protein
VWLTDDTVRRLGARPGATVSLLGDRPARVRVAGVYRNLADLPEADFWCPVRKSIYQGSLFSDRAPPPVLLVSDQATLVRLSRALGSPELVELYERPLRLPLTLPQAEQTAGRFHQVAARFGDYVTWGDMRVETGSLDFAVRRAHAVAGALAAPVSATAWAGSGAALLLVAAAGRLWVERHRREVRLLAAKGVGPVVLGVQGGLEMLGPLVAGALLGWLAALWLVPLLGPSRLLDPGAPAAALGRVAVVTAAGLAALVAVTGLTSRRLVETPLGRRPRWVALVPWELTLLAGSVVLWARVRASGLPVVTVGPSIPSLTPAQMLFPLVFLLGATLLAIRVVAWLLPRLRRLGQGWPNAPYLASRRLTGTPRAALLVVLTAAVPIGVMMFSAALTGTLRYTTDAKAQVFVGSDTAVGVIGDQPVPDGLGLPATVVRRIDGASVDGAQVDVLVVDPASFARAAFWDHRFAHQPLAELLARLGGGDLPAVAVGLPGTAQPTLRLPTVAGGVDVPARVVATAAAFPGQRGRPLLVVGRRRLDWLPGLLVAGTELWVRGPPAAAQQAVARAGLPVRSVVTAGQASQAPNLVAVVWTFDFLQALGLLAAAMAAAGLLLYLHARQQRSQLAYLLARRMGLSRASHLWSLMLESGASLGLGYLLGVVLSVGGVGAVYRFLDPQPTVAPHPLYVQPNGAAAGLAAAVVLVCLLAATVAQRTADHANPADLLRLGVH